MKRTAVITGASSGMGREAAVQIAERFRYISEIWLLGRNREELKITAEMVRKAGKTPKVIAGDITDAGFVSQVVSLLSKEKAGVKLLFNSAGLGYARDFTSCDSDRWDETLRVNVLALTSFTRQVLPFVVRGGRIINMSSASAFLPQPGFAVYAASKSYVLSLSLALSRELKDRDITVTAVCPGPVDTEFLDRCNDGGQEPAIKKLFTAEPGPVVKKALKDSFRGRTVSVYGLPMKLVRLAGQVLPEELLMRVLY